MKTITLSSKLRKIVGKRYENLQLLKHDIEILTGEIIKEISESESDRLEEMDFMIDFYFENEEFEVHTLFYLKDNDGKYYITEV
jgi:hypothetical protein